MIELYNLVFILFVNDININFQIFLHFIHIYVHKLSIYETDPIGIFCDSSNLMYIDVYLDFNLGDN